MMRKVCIFLLAALMLCTGWCPCFAAGLAIHPMEQFVSPLKPAVYIASNQSSKAIAVEVIPETWTITEDGEELREVTQDLVVYPSQFILKGTTYKKIKVGLRDATRNIDQERCYRVTIRELPISLEADEPGTYRIYRASAYRTSFYIQPKRKLPQLALTSVELGEGKLSVRFRNDGNVHVHLRNPELTIFDGAGKAHVVESKDFYEPIQGENMHAGITRVFHLDLAGLEQSTEFVRGELRFNDGDTLQGKVFELQEQ